MQWNTHFTNKDTDAQMPLGAQSHKVQIYFHFSQFHVSSVLVSNPICYYTWYLKSHTAKDISTDCLHSIKFSPEYSACCPALLSYCQLSYRLSLPSHRLTLFPVYYSYQNCWDDYRSMIRNISKTCPLCKKVLHYSIVLNQYCWDVPIFLSDHTQREG